MRAKKYSHKKEFSIDQNEWKTKKVPDKSSEFQYALMAEGRTVAMTQNKEDAELLLIACRGHSQDLKYAGQLLVRMKRNDLSLYLLDQAVASSKTGIVIADVNQKDLPLIYVNPGFEKITGYSVSETIGRNCRFLQGDDRDQPALAKLRKAIKAGKDCKVVLRNYKKDKTLFWNELHLSPIHDDAGNLTHFVGIQTDVTERVENQRRLIKLKENLKTRNEQLETLNKTKNELLGMAAHDLRNPLSGIVGYCQILLDELTGPVDKQQRPLIERILKSSQFMSKMVNDLPDLAKIESGKLDLEIKKLNLAQLVEDVLELQYPRAAGKEIELAFTSSGQMGITVELDENKISQVIDNLISNAIKFSKPKSRVEIHLQQNSKTVLLSVKDNGEGIAKKEMHHLFKPFSKTSTQSTAGEKSTGLGLAICKRITDGHGGRIWAESKLRKGTTFFVELPIRQKRCQ
jgi:PAS domain S-box-containing protein